MTETALNIEEEQVERPAVASAKPALMIAGIDSMAIIRQLWGRRKFIAILTGIAAVLGLLIGFLLPVRYTATTKILTPQQTAPSSALLMNQLANAGAGSLMTAVTGSAIGLTNPNDLYIGLLNSRPIADAIIQRYGLQKLYGARNMTISRTKLAQWSQIVTEKSGLLAISVTDKDGNRAAAMANAYTEELSNLTMHLAVTEASQRRAFYEEQLKNAQDDLVAAEVAFRKVQSSNGLVELDAQAKAQITNLAQFHVQIAAKQMQVRALRSYSTEINPDLKLAETELASLQSEAARLEAHNPQKHPGDPGLQDLAGAGPEFLRAEHELEHRQVIFDLLLKQLDAARLDESKEATVIQVVEPAIQPDQSSSPKRVRIILLFAVAGLLLGCSLVLVEWWKKLSVEHSPTPGN